MKKLFFGMLVAVTAISGSVATYASSFVHSNGKATPVWFRFNGSTGDEGDPEAYTATVSIPNNCGGGPALCAIFAEPGTDANHPDLDTQTDSANKLF